MPTLLMQEVNLFLPWRCAVQKPVVIHSRKALNRAGMTRAAMVSRVARAARAVVVARAGGRAGRGALADDKRRQAGP